MKNIPESLTERDSSRLRSERNFIPQTIVLMSGLVKAYLGGTAEAEPFVPTKGMMGSFYNISRLTILI